MIIVNDLLQCAKRKYSQKITTGADRAIYGAVVEFSAFAKIHVVWLSFSLMSIFKVPGIIVLVGWYLRLCTFK